MGATPGIQKNSNFVMKNIGVIGSGFGLYGYAVALNSLGFSIYTLQKYSNFINERNDLVNIPFKYVKNESELVDYCSDVVIARTPELQKNFLEKYHDKFDNFFLEKPLGSNRAQHIQIIEFLGEKKVSFKLGYLFKYTDWYREVGCIFSKYDNLEIRISWNLKRDLVGWKKYINSESALFNNYAIQFFEMFYNLKLLQFNHFSTTPNSILVTGVSPLNAERKCILEINKDSGVDSFVLEVWGDEILKFQYFSIDPLGKREFIPRDYRIPALIKHIESNLKNTNCFNVENLILNFRDKFNV